MKEALHILCGELERLFSHSQLKQLCTDFLGFNFDETEMYDKSKAIFVRRLVDHCVDAKAVEALTDAVVFLKKGMVDQRIEQVYHGYDQVELPSGEEIAGYSVVKKIDDDGVCAVYQCESIDPLSDQEEDRYGLKVVHPEYAFNHHAVQRFLTMMRLTRSFDGLVTQPVESVGLMDDGRPYVVTRWVPGTRLRRLLPLSTEAALDIFEAIIEALNVIHENGLVHGDLRPENVLVRGFDKDDGDLLAVTLLGLGLNKLFGQTNHSHIKSRPAYGVFAGLAPEQARGKTIDVRTDIYALGALLYEMTTNTPPFTGQTPLDLVAAHLIEPILLPSEMIEEPIPSSLDDLILKMMEKEITERPQTLDEVRRLLSGVRRDIDEQTAAVMQTGTREDIGIGADLLLERPADEEALEDVKSRAAENNAWGAAVEIFEEAASASDDEMVTRRLLMEVAQAATQYLKDYQKAAQIYDHFLQTDPSDTDVQQARFQLLRVQGQFDELVEALGLSAEATEDETAKYGYIREIIDVYEQDLKDYDKAFDYCLASFNWAEPDETELARIEKLAGQADRYEDLAAAGGAAAQVAEETGNQDTAWFLYDRTGHYYLDKLDQASYALTCFQKALEYRPTDESALTAVAEMYRSAQQWSELADVLIRLSELERTPAKSRTYLVDTAQLYFERLEMTTEARQLLESVLADDPEHKEATDLQIKICEVAEQWDQVARLLQSRIDTLSDEPAQLEARYKLGELYEDRLDNLASAKEQYQKALLIDANHLEAIKGLERIFARTGDSASLRENLEHQLSIAATPRQRIVLMERLADLLEEEFKDYDGAIGHFRAVLEIEPQTESAILALSRLCRKTERWEELVDILDQRAESAESDDDKKALLTERAEIIKEKIKDAQRAAQAFSEVTSLGVDDALGALAKTHEEAGDYDAAIRTLRRMLEADENQEIRLHLLTRIAGLQLDKLKNPQEAILTLGEARDMAPEDRTVLVEMRRIFLLQGNYAAALDTYEQEMTLVEGKLARAALFAQMGVICLDQLKDTHRAVQYFEEALKLDEGNLVAGDNLSGIYRRAGQWEKALPIYKWHADAIDTLPEDKKLELLMSLGDAYDYLGQADAAESAFHRALEFSADEPYLIKRLGEVALDQGDFRTAQTQLNKYLTTTGMKIGQEEKVDLMVKLGRACLGSGNIKEAAKLARQVITSVPDHLMAHLLHASVLEEKGDYRGMVEACKRAITMMEDDNEDRPALLVRAASVLFEKLKDADGAAKLLNEALKANPSDRTILGELLKIYTATKRFTQLIEVVLRIAELIDDPAQLARYYLTVAKIYRRELKQPDKAVLYFELAQEQDPELPDIDQIIVDVLAENQAWEQLERRYKRQIAALSENATVEDKLAVYAPLCNLLVDKLNNLKDGILVAEAICKIDPDNVDWQEMLVDLYGWDREYTQKATQAHRALLQKNTARVESFRMLYRIFSADEAPDKAWCVASILTLLNQASDNEQQYYHDYRPEDLPAPAQRLKDDHWTRQLYHPDMDQSISMIFSVIRDGILAAKGHSHEHFGLHPRAAIDATMDSSEFAGFVSFACGTLGITPPPLHYQSGHGAGFQLVETRPPCMIVGDELSEIMDRKAIAFTLGQQLTLLRPGLFVSQLVTSGTELSSWLLASVKSFVPNLPIPGELAGAVTERLAPLREGLSTNDWERLQGYVQTFVAKSADVNLKRWVRSVNYTADRAGLLVCGDVNAAVAVLKKQVKDKTELSKRLQAITLFVVSDEFFALRDYLEIALRNA